MMNISSKMSQDHSQWHSKNFVSVFILLKSEGNDFGLILLNQGIIGRKTVPILNRNKTDFIILDIEYFSIRV